MTILDPLALILFISMKFCIKSTFKARTVHRIILMGNRSPYRNSIAFLSQMIDFVLASSVDPQDMLHYAAFYLDLQCLPKNPYSKLVSKSVNPYKPSSTADIKAVRWVYWSDLCNI